MLIDISNPLDFSQGFPPTLFVKDTDSLGEQIQREFPQARVVKTLNTMNADLMVDPASLGAESSVFVSGDDAAAKQTVTELLESFGHTDVVDLGDIRPPGAPRCTCRSGCASWGPSAPPRSTSRSCAEMSLMTGRTVLVTGGTGGIGLATAAGLAGLGARVGIVGRDAARGEAAAARLRGAGGLVDVFTADLSAQREVRRLAGEVLAAYPRLDVLVNNAGGYWATRHTTEDGLERTFAVNHLAPFLLTDLLLERLRASAPARVVTVSSGAQAMGRIDLDDLQGPRTTAANGRTTSPSSPTSCSPSSSPGGSRGRGSPRTSSTPEWSGRTSDVRTRRGGCGCCCPSSVRC